MLDWATSALMLLPVQLPLKPVSLLGWPSCSLTCRDFLQGLRLLLLQFWSPLVGDSLHLWELLPCLDLLSVLLYHREYPTALGCATLVLFLVVFSQRIRLTWCPRYPKGTISAWPFLSRFILILIVFLSSSWCYCKLWSEIWPDSSFWCICATCFSSFMHL